MKKWTPFFFSLLALTVLGTVIVFLQAKDQTETEKPYEATQVQEHPTWQLELIQQNGQDISLISPSQITLILGPSGEVKGFSSVNNYFGMVKLNDKGGVKWGRGLASTRRGGDPKLLKQEALYLDLLTQTTQISQTDQKLHFQNPQGTLQLSYRLQDEAEPSPQCGFQATPCCRE